MTTAAGAVIVLASFLVVDFGETSSSRFHPALLFLAALWIGPFVLHAALVRTRVGTAFGGVVLLVATGGLLWAIFDSESSTAAIGLVTALFGGTYPLALAALGVDRMVDAWELDDWPRLRAHLNASSALFGLVAGVLAVTAVSKLVNTTEADHPLPLALALGTTTVAATLSFARTLVPRTPRPVP